MEGRCAVWPVCAGTQASLSTCSVCALQVHLECYGLAESTGRDFTCDRCQAKQTATCMFCPRSGGALRRSSVGGWAHVVCALFLDGPQFDPLQGRIVVDSAALSAQREQRCTLCDTATNACVGCCMPCHVPKCPNWFHPSCAQAKGLLVADYSKGLDYGGYCSTHAAKAQEHHRELNEKAESKRRRLADQPARDDRRRSNTTRPTPAHEKLQPRAALAAFTSRPNASLAQHVADHPLPPDALPHMLPMLEDMAEGARHAREQLKHLEAEQKRLKFDADRALVRRQEGRERERESSELNPSLSCALSLVYKVLCPHFTWPTMTPEEEERFAVRMADALSSYSGADTPAAKEEFMRKTVQELCSGMGTS
eukprot:comp6815_c0_seq1/m.2562 comp6815_c0_seq1/g.2562  ORF comp6815_c0_seq1/g.2562 comp6815_c0_seq1/m.2562 type:complete len:367 (-) comp6815_c0_seq1:184-1284(-)